MITFYFRSTQYKLVQLYHKFVLGQFSSTTRIQFSTTLVPCVQICTPNSIARILFNSKVHFCIRARYKFQSKCTPRVPQIQSAHQVSTPQLFSGLNPSIPSVTRQWLSTDIKIFIKRLSGTKLEFSTLWLNMDPVVVKKYNFNQGYDGSTKLSICIIICTP